MNLRALRILLTVLTVVLVTAACKKPQAASAPPEPAAAPAAAPAESAPPPAAAAEPASLPAAAGGPAALASQDTNWSGVIAEIMEFRRKGNTLTAKIRLRNQGGSGKQQAELKWEDVYLLDAGAGKKYEPLKDENGAYIAGNTSGWKDRWYKTMESGETQTTWVKFPAPPAEVRAITLQLADMPPFEDLAIQD